MAKPSPVERTLAVMNALLEGEDVDRARAAELMESEPEAGYRRIQLIAALIDAVEVVPGTGPYRIRLVNRPAKPAPSEAAIATCFGASVANLFRGSRYEQGIRDALEHLAASSGTTGQFASFERKFFFVGSGGEKALPEQGPMLDQVAGAVLEQREIRIRYRHFDGALENESVAPLSVAIYQHQLYVVARRKDGSIKPYRFARLLDLRVLQRRFDYPDRTEYDPAQLLGPVFGMWLDHDAPIETVRLRLSSDWAVHARSHRWHASQRVRDDASGAVLLELRVRICPELVSWILSFGAHAEVLAPTHLRADVADRVQALAATYMSAPRRAVRADPAGAARRRGKPSG